MTKSRVLAIFFGISGLTLVYIFQSKLFYDPFQYLLSKPIMNEFLEVETGKYIGSKILRFVLNDGLALTVIYGVFGPGKYVKFAAMVLLFGLLVLLPTYLILALYFYQETYLFINHLHRLILNPVIMMLLIPAFYVQKIKTK